VDRRCGARPRRHGAAVRWGTRLRRVDVAVARPRADSDRAVEVDGPAVGILHHDLQRTRRPVLDREPERDVELHARLDGLGQRPLEGDGRDGDPVHEAVMMKSEEDIASSVGLLEPFWPASTRL